MRCKKCYQQLSYLPGGNNTNPISPEVEECSNMRRAFLYSEAGKRALDVLYNYAKKNLLWLNVYVKVLLIVVEHL